MPRRRQKVAEQVLAAAATAARLSCLPAQFFVPECFDQGFSLTAPTASSAVEFLKVPDGNKRQDYVNFIEEISLKNESPEWVGLPSTAEMLLRVKAGSEFSMRLLKLQDDDTAGGGGSGDRFVDWAFGRHR